MTPAPVVAALAGSPPQWAAIALIIVALFAPSLLPKLARQAGRTLRRSLLRLLGFPQPGRNEPRSPVWEEVLPPEHPAPTLRAGMRQSIECRLPQRPPARLWPRVILAAAAAAVLLWYLLHPR